VASANGDGGLEGKGRKGKERKGKERKGKERREVYDLLRVV